MTNRNLHNTSLGGLTPVTQDRTGLGWDEAEVRQHCAFDINSGNYFQRRTKNLMTDFQKAATICDDATAMFDRALDRMLVAEGKASASAKKAAGNVRSAGEALAQGLAKVEKLANFDRLDHYVALLERAASAMTLLAELEKSGKLEKITNALK